MSEVQQEAVKQVNLSRIRDELRGMWASMGMEKKAVIRARSHNLVVYHSGSRDQMDEAIQRIIRITAARPGRVILIHDDSEGEADIDAWVTVYCQAQNSALVCGEMIVLDGSGGAASEIHSTVLSLLAADLPFYLWWMAVPDKTSHLFQRLSHGADRLIVDSDTYPNPAKDLLALKEITDLPVGDLAWTRLTSWRRMIAQLWDLPDLRTAFDAIRSVDIHYAAHGDFLNSERALYLAGWLMDSLGWQLEEVSRGPTGGYTIQWKHQGWSGKIELVEKRQDSVSAGEIVGFYIQAGSKPPFVMPRIEFASDCDCVTIHYNDATPGYLRRNVPFTSVGISQALVEELDQPFDTSFVGTMKQVGLILSKLDETIH